AGSFVDLMEDLVVITEVVEVTPKEGADRFSGYVMVVRPLDLRPAIDRLVGAGVAGTIEAGGQTRTIGSPPPNAKTQEMAVPSWPEMKLVVAVPPMLGGMPVPLVVGGGAAAGLGLVLFVLGLVRKRAAAATPEVAIGTAPTALSNANLAGAPSPT